MRVYEASTSYRVVANIGFRKVDSAQRAVEYLRGAFDEYPLQESFWVIFLNRRNAAMGRQMISLGTLTCTLVHPREVLRSAIVASAAAILVAHNHPSGDPAPSAADIQLTRQLREACVAVDIPMLDHIIVGERDGDPMGKGYYSFREAGLI
jgi:DNA repair protein RadC